MVSEAADLPANLLDELPGLLHLALGLLLGFSQCGVLFRQRGHQILQLLIGHRRIVLPGHIRNPFTAS